MTYKVSSGTLNVCSLTLSNPTLFKDACNVSHRMRYKQIRGIINFPYVDPVYYVLYSILLVKLRHLLLIPTTFYCNTPNFETDNRLGNLNSGRSSLAKLIRNAFAARIRCGCLEITLASCVETFIDSRQMATGKCF